MFARAKINFSNTDLKTSLREIIGNDLTFSLVIIFRFQSFLNEIQRLSKHINKANAKFMFYRYKSSLNFLLNQMSYVSCALSAKHLQTLAIWIINLPIIFDKLINQNLQDIKGIFPYIPPPNKKNLSQSSGREEKKEKSKQFKCTYCDLCVAKSFHPVHQKQILSNKTS